MFVEVESVFSNEFESDIFDVGGSVVEVVVDNVVVNIESFEDLSIFVIGEGRNIYFVYDF